jgi:hypothetical protein
LTFNALNGVLFVPALAAALLAVLPDYRLTARLNVAATILTLICALSLFFSRPQPGSYIYWSMISMARSSCSPLSSALPPASSAPAISVASSKSAG